MRNFYFLVWHTIKSVLLDSKTAILESSEENKPDDFRKGRYNNGICSDRDGSDGSCSDRDRSGECGHENGEAAELQTAAGKTGGLRLTQKGEKR